MVKENPSINLLGNKGKSLVEQLLDWALAVGRLLIIVTQTVALAAFLYRFSIDRRIIDLHDEIKINQTIVSAFASREEEYRKLQSKLNVSKNQSQLTTANIKLFQDLITTANSQKVTFNNLDISSTTMEMTIRANSIDSISSFLDSVRSLDQIQAVKIDKVENRPASSEILITLSASLPISSLSAQLEPVNLNEVSNPGGNSL